MKLLHILAQLIMIQISIILPQQLKMINQMKVIFFIPSSVHSMFILFVFQLQIVVIGLAKHYVILLSMPWRCFMKNFFIALCERTFKTAIQVLL